MFLTVNQYDIGRFDIQINGEMICTTFGETDNSTFDDTDHGSCSAVTIAAEGKKQKKYTQIIRISLFLSILLLLFACNSLYVDL